MLIVEQDNSFDMLKCYISGVLAAERIKSVTD